MPKTYWDINNSKEALRGYNKQSGIEGRKFITALIRDGESVLDVGCGSGILYEQIKKYCKDVKYKGVDITDGFIEVCKEDYPEVEWEVGDMRDIKEADESWDNVVMYHCIEYAGPDFQKVIFEGLRVAKKRLIVTLWKGLLDKDKTSNWKLMEDEIEYETVYSASDWFRMLDTFGYNYAPWIEHYVDEFRYNLAFVLDKRFKRIETIGGANDYLTQK